ncbi:MAG: endonuclease III [Pseudomonadota bacterium]
MVRKVNSFEKRIRETLRILKKLYPKNLRPWARRSKPFFTLIGTILSAQTTDAQVDQVTPKLFRQYPTPTKLASARVSDVEKIIKPVGLHKAKSKSIIAIARMLRDEFDSKVPAVRPELMRLPGVGRKTANVVLIKSFGTNAMPVDTHVFRVANRIGLAKGKTPKDVEAGLERIIPERVLGAAHFWLIHHGRTLCTARSPKCNECPLARLCEYALMSLRVTK